MIDDHRAAVQHDLLAYGFHLRDIGTERLWWDEAVAVLTEQPPHRSALFRAVFPEKYDRNKVLDRLEMLAVLMVRGQHLLGNQSEIDTNQLPSTWDQLFGPAEEEDPRDLPDRPPLMTFEEIDARMGWDRPPLEVVREPEKMTMEEIDRRMGWAGEDDVD